MKFPFYLLFFSLLTSACGSSKKLTNQQPAKPMESYSTQPTEEAQQLSTVNIPIRLKASEIEKLINNKITGNLYNDNSLEGDNLKVTATKSQPIKISLNGLEMTYRVPLKLHIFKALIGNKGVEADGELALQFKTRLNIAADWQASSVTELISHQWIATPKLKAGVVELPITYIADEVVKRGKTEITKNIDAAIKSQLVIRQYVKDAWSLMQKPVKVSDEYNMWVKITPQSISMTPLVEVNDVISSTINVSAFSEVIAGQQPVFRPNSDLPPFRLGAVNTDSFTVNLKTDIPFEEAEALAKKYVLGQTFNPVAKKTVTVSSFRLFGQGDKMVADVGFSGSYNGSLYLIGRPYLNTVTNSIEMADLDYELNTKNFLLKSAKWLFDKTIIKKMKESMVFPLDAQVQNFKTIINQQLKNYPLNNNATINGAMNDLKIQNVGLTPSGIVVKISSTGKLNVDVKGLDGF